MSVVFPIHPNDDRQRRYIAAAGQTAFAVDFPFQDNRDITVRKIAADGTPTLLTETADYTLTGAGAASGGLVTLTAGAAAGQIIEILGLVILDRLTSVVRNGLFSSRAMDDEHDRHRLIHQELRRDIDRSIKTDYDIPGPKVTMPAGAGRFLKTNDTGELVDGGAADDIVNAQANAERAEAAQVAAEAAAAQGNGTPVVPSRATLAGVDPLRAGAYLTETGRAGSFAWNGSNMSGLVAADPAQGVYVPPASDATGASGAWVRQHELTMNVDWFGAVSGAADNTPAFQAAVNFCESFFATLFSPQKTYLFNNTTPALRIKGNFFKWECRSILGYSSPTGVMIEMGPADPETASMISPFLYGVRCYMTTAPATDGTGAICFRMTRVVQGFFEACRTDNFHIHYDTFGLTRPIFSACLMFGNTLWPSAPVTAAPGSCFLKLDAYVFGSGVRRPAANVKITNGSEIACNDATRINMAYGIWVRDCDGLFTDTSTYVGLVKIANVFFTSSIPDAVWVNIQLENFNDGGQRTSASCVEFTESSDGFHTGGCNSIRVGGILSGSGGNGIRQNVANMADMSVDATIKACSSYGIQWLKGVGLNIGGANFFNIDISPVNNPSGAKIAGIRAARSDTGHTLASAGLITLPVLGDYFVVTGTTTVNTINGGWDGRIVHIRIAGANTFSQGGNMVLGTAYVTTGTNDTLSLVYDAVVGKWIKLGSADN